MQNERTSAATEDRRTSDEAVAATAGNAAQVEPLRVVDIASGEYRAAISTFGASIQELTYAGEPLLEGYPRGEEPPMSANIVMSPWPNRVEDGEYTFHGSDNRLVINEPPRNNAIHGFAGFRTWGVQELTADRAVLWIDFGDEQGWPWRMRVTADFQVGDQGLSVAYTVANRSGEACPLAFGVHLYPSAHGAPLDETRLVVPVVEYLPLSQDRNLPDGDLRPTAEIHCELAGGQDMRGAWYDHAFTAGGEGERCSTLTAADGRATSITTAGEFAWFQVYTADPDHGEGYPGRGRAVAVEPMTVPPNALRTGKDLAELGPGEQHTYRLRIADATARS